MQVKILNKTEIIRLAKLGHELQLENILLKDALQEAQTEIKGITKAKDSFYTELLLYKKACEDLVNLKEKLYSDIEQVEAREQGLREALEGIAWSAGSNTVLILPAIKRRAEEALGQVTKLDG